MSKIEDVARAICRGNDWRDYVPDARAAIAAMRDIPYALKTIARDTWTEHENEMLAQGCTHISRVQTIDRIWQSMIDAALKE